MLQCTCNACDPGLGMHVGDTRPSPQEAYSSRHVCVLSRVPLSVTPMDRSLPGSSVHAILQAGILEWVAISSPRGASRPRD